MAAAWDDLLQGEELAYLTTEPPREPRIEPLPDDVHPALLAALARQGVERLYAHQAEAWTAARAGGNVIVTTGTASGKTLAFNLPVLDALATAPKNRALYLYPTKALAQDQARALGELAVPGVRAAIYDGDTPTERAPADPQVGEPHPHEPGHAPPRRAATPRSVGRRPPQPPLRRDRRSARLPRRLRLARRERAAPPATARANLRRRAPVHLRVGDDRQPGRAGVLAARRQRHRDRRRCRAAGRADGCAVESRASRRRARPARELPRRRGAPPGRARAARPADDLLREEPQDGGAHPSHGVRPRRLDDGEASRAVPCGLHAAAAPRHRAAARRGRAARCVVHGRARARHRHRVARLRDLRRLSRHDREPSPAMGPRGPARSRPGA